MDYDNFSKHYKLIVIDLNKQTELQNFDLKQQINFIGKLQEREATMFHHWKIRRNDFWILTKFCGYHIEWKNKRL